MLVLLFVLATVGAFCASVFVTARIAGAAETKIYVVMRWTDIPWGSQVIFKDVGGNCDKDKNFPSFYAVKTDGWPDHTAGFGRFYLFTAKDGGSCAFEATNAQFEVVVDTLDGRTGSVKINESQPRAGGSYSLSCYDQRSLSCSTRTPYYTEQGDFTISLPSSVRPTVQTGPSGYQYCAPENPPGLHHRCAWFQSGEMRATVAYGRFGKFTYHSNVLNISECDSATFVDPIPNVPKGCWYKITGPR